MIASALSKDNWRKLALAPIDPDGPQLVLKKESKQ
jgi:hypothetical protein